MAVAGLLLLSVIPVLGGAFRLTDLAGGGITPDNARFFDSPVPVVAHIVGATVYTLLGAFQFVPALRARRSWHRIVGRILIPAGLIAALSGMWMAAFYSFPEEDLGLVVARLFFGGAMAASIVLGVVAIVRRDFRAHGAWMTRAYALGVAAGTQAVVFGVWILVAGSETGMPASVLLVVAWAINAVVAELVILARLRRARAVRHAAA
ncbi:MAG TPA: DUF2306 domain-containing protein [Naasia sp.]